MACAESQERREPYRLIPDQVYLYRSALGEISQADQELFDYIDAAASWTWCDMTDGWKRQRRPNKDIDTTALQDAVFLEARCSEALEQPTIFLHPNTNQLRFGLYSGALTVRQLLPVPIEDRPALRETMVEWHGGDLGWRTPPPESHVELIDCWRQWLRHDGMRRAPVGAEMHGEASIFLAATFEIHRALNPGVYVRRAQPDRLSYLPTGNYETDQLWHRPLDPDEKQVYPIERDSWRYRKLPAD